MHTHTHTHTHTQYELRGAEHDSNDIVYHINILQTAAHTLKSLLLHCMLHSPYLKLEVASGADLYTCNSMTDNKSELEPQHWQKQRQELIPRLI